MSSIQRFLEKLVRRLEEAGIPQMVTGSVASTCLGEPRQTRDVDIVIDPVTISSGPGGVTSVSGTNGIAPLLRPGPDRQGRTLRRACPGIMSQTGERENSDRSTPAIGEVLA